MILLANSHRLVSDVYEEQENGEDKRLRSRRCPSRFREESMPFLFYLQQKT